MKLTDNKGFDAAALADYRVRMKASGTDFLIDDPEENTDDYVHFYFIGKFEGREAIHDAVLYTLRLQHQGELFEIAEDRARKYFPQYKKMEEVPDEVEEEIGLFLAEVIMELEQEGQVKVKEHVDIDPNIDFGIGIDGGLHVEDITPEVIAKFVRDYNQNTLTLDETLYCFQEDDETN